MVFAGKVLNPRGRLASYGGLSVEGRPEWAREDGKSGWIAAAF